MSDKYGIGKAVESMSLVAMVIFLGLLCSGNLMPVVNIIFGGG